MNDIARTEDAAATGVTWDLSDLFAGADDPKINEALVQAKADAEAFAQRYRGKIHVKGGPDATLLLAGLREFEELHERTGRVSAYVHLLYDSDTRDETSRDLQQKVEQRTTELRNLTLFFDLEWLELDDGVAQRLIDDPQLAPYRHYLQHERVYRPHKLSEPEEKIVNEKDVTGSRAWGRLHTEIVSSLKFPFKRDGTTEDLSLEQVRALMYEPDRAVRQQAHESLYKVLAGQGQVLTYVYDTLIQDHQSMDRLRRYESPMENRHLGNEVDDAAIQTMLEVTESNYSLAHEYFRVKAKVLGMQSLELYDQYAPYQQGSTKVPWQEAERMVLESYGAMHPSFREAAEDFFERRWIDAEPRPGKRGGAYCWSVSPKLHPYVLCSYNGSPRDAMTVAHELGHGLHGMLARKQSLFNYHSTLPLAETASIFGEMMVFDRLAEREPDKKARLGLVAGKIEDAFATVYRQNLLTRFEQGAFKARTNARLTPEKLGQVWLDANRPYYGDVVALTQGYEWGWSYIPHFIHSRFYCYAYVFGQLLVLALYRMYQEEGKSFIPKFVTLLESGGSDTPDRLLAPLGVNFRDGAFWQKGFDELSRLVEWAKELAAD
ncbi:MAG TPA: M3 family oligoendopeptidase [Chloroflexota bacterium]|nr:M3 family oligoendopeptidase [Chloroflexota bacterium]